MKPPFRANGFRRAARISRERGAWLVARFPEIERGTRSVWCGAVRRWAEKGWTVEPLSPSDYLIQRLKGVREAGRVALVLLDRSALTIEDLAAMVDAIQAEEAREDDEYLRSLAERHRAEVAAESERGNLRPTSPQDGA